MWNRITHFLNKQFFHCLCYLVPPAPSSLPKDPKLILVFSTTGIGDSLFDSAAIKSLKQGYPHATLVVAAHHRRQSVARHNPFIDQVFPLSKSPISQIQFLLRFRKKRPDLIVALHVNEEAVPLGYLLNRHLFFGAIERCQSFSFLLSHPIETKYETHIVEETLKVAMAAGGATVNRGMVYQVAPEDLTVLLKHHPGLKKPWIIFQTGGGRTLSWRNWPIESYIQAIQWLREHYHGHQIILTGGHDNRSTGYAIEAATPWVINLVEKTTLEETAALLKGASMLVTTDTGVMHLGFAIGCPTLALLHYQSPASMYGPLDYSPGHEILQLATPEKNLFLKKNPMSQIAFAHVRAAMTRILSL